MPTVVLTETAGVVHREARPANETAPPVLLLHGFPESSRMWVGLMERLADSGRRSIAPDLYCLGDSTDPGPATYERNVEAVETLCDALGLERLAIVVHDWGAFIGLTWAALHSDRVEALVLSNCGFFSDGRWHGAAELLRGEQGEDAIAALDFGAFGAMLSDGGAGFSNEDLEAYWRPFADGRGREATLEFYRSMDFEKLAPYETAPASLGAPTLLLWGEEDDFAPLSGAHRFEREIAGSRLVVVPGAGHFVFETAPERCIAEVAEFLDRAAAAA
jgi:haloalkane dehalogenase